MAAERAGGDAYPDYVKEASKCREFLAGYSESAPGRRSRSYKYKDLIVSALQPQQQRQPCWKARRSWLRLSSRAYSDTSCASLHVCARARLRCLATCSKMWRIAR